MNHAKRYRTRTVCCGLVWALLLLLPLLVLSGCGSDSDNESPPPDNHTGTTITCPCTADTYLDEWKPYDNFNYQTRILLATNTNIHHGIGRGLFKFEIPAEVTPSAIKKATIYLSSCSHCSSGYSGLAGFYALNIPFDEVEDTWFSLDGGDWDESVHSEALLPEGHTWNQAVDGKAPADALGFDVTGLLQGNLDKVRENGIMMRFVDEHQDPYIHQNVSTRESTDPLDFAPFITITTEQEPLQVVNAGTSFAPFTALPRGSD